MICCFPPEETRQHQTSFILARKENRSPLKNRCERFEINRNRAQKPECSGQLHDDSRHRRLRQAGSMLSRFFSFA